MHKKRFYVRTLFGQSDFGWDAKNFTDEELEVIQRFLNEFGTNNRHEDGSEIETIMILNEEV